MNKLYKITSIALFLSISASSFGWKFKTDSLVYAGAWGGTSYARIMGYLEPTKPLLGKAFGIKICIEPQREYNFNTGIAFIEKGFISDIDHYDVYGTGIGKYPVHNLFSYINIPLGINYNLGKKKFNVYISGGFDFDILLKQKAYSNNVPDKYNGIEVLKINTENTDSYKKFNFGLYVGVGVEYRFKPNIIAFADIKYMYGVNNILSINTYFDYKQRPITTGLGIKIGIPINLSSAR